MNERCIEWSGLKDREGYGETPRRIRSTGRRRVHRWAYELFYGPIPQGLLVMHRCDNPSCINPTHLTVGTNQDNQRDCAAKGRKALQKRTHCPRGHLLSPDNIKPYEWRVFGRRTCRTCGNALQRQKYRVAAP